MTTLPSRNKCVCQYEHEHFRLFTGDGNNGNGVKNNFTRMAVKEVKGY